MNNIKKIEYYDNKERLDILNESIGDSITYGNSLSILEDLKENNIIDNREYEIIKISLNDRTLVSAEYKNILRADILKGILTVLLS